jgi:hypothetical protein
MNGQTGGLDEAEVTLEPVIEAVGKPLGKPDLLRPPAEAVGDGE